MNVYRITTILCLNLLASCGDLSSTVSATQSTLGDYQLFGAIDQGPCKDAKHAFDTPNNPAQPHYSISSVAHAQKTSQKIQSLSFDALIHGYYVEDEYIHSANIKSEKLSISSISQTTLRGQTLTTFNLLPNQVMTMSTEGDEQTMGIKTVVISDNEYAGITFIPANGARPIELKANCKVINKGLLKFNGENL